MCHNTFLIPKPSTCSFGPPRELKAEMEQSTEEGLPTLVRALLKGPLGFANGVDDKILALRVSEPERRENGKQFKRQ